MFLNFGKKFKNNHFGCSAESSKNIFTKIKLITTFGFLVNGMKTFHLSNRITSLLLRSLCDPKI
jgi:hypothetical protein